VETLDQVRADLQRRDAIDSGRAASPLRPAEDAILIDTDTLSIDEVVDRVLRLAVERGAVAAESDGAVHSADATEPRPEAGRTR
jgi:cytidylate kinase